MDLGSCLMLQLTPAASRELYLISMTHLGQRLVLFLNDVPVGARRVEQAIADGLVLIFLETPEDGPARAGRPDQAHDLRHHEGGGEEEVIFAP